MKILFSILTILGSQSSSNFYTSSKTKIVNVEKEATFGKKISTTQFEEENLDVKEFAPGYVEDGLLSIDKIKENGQWIITIAFDFDKYLTTLGRAAESAGLLTKKTNFEKNKDNLIVDGNALYSKIMAYFYKKTKKEPLHFSVADNNEGGFNSLPGQNIIKIKLIPDIHRVIGPLNIKSSDFVFYDKSLSFLASKGVSSSWENVWDDKTLFLDEGEDLKDFEDKDKYKRKFGDLIDEIKYMEENKFVPTSKTITIFKANQPSEIRKFDKGYNFDIKLDNKPQGSIGLIRFYFLLLIGLIFLPFIYFLIKKWIRK